MNDTDALEHALELLQTLRSYFHESADGYFCVQDDEGKWVDTDVDIVAVLENIDSFLEVMA